MDLKVINYTDDVLWPLVTLHCCFNCWDYVMSHDVWWDKCERCGRKQKYHILRCYSCLCLEELREAISTDYLEPGEYYVVAYRNRLNSWCFIRKFFSVKLRCVVLTSLCVLSTSSGRSSAVLFNISSGNFGKSLKLFGPSVRWGSSSRMGFLPSSSQRTSSNDLFSCTKMVLL